MFCAGGYGQGSPRLSLALAVLTGAGGSNVHFSVESEAHSDHRHKPETHRASHWLQRLATSPCSVGLCVSTRANHEHRWCFISPSGCGTPASSRHCCWQKVTVVIHLNHSRAVIFPSLFFFGTRELGVCMTVTCRCTGQNEANQEEHKNTRHAT